MLENCLQKQQDMIRLFSKCSTQEQKYEVIIELGRKAKGLEPQYKIPENLVKGCQSTMYLRSWIEGGNVYFAGESDALISAGLAELLLAVYSGEPPEVILKCPPDYLETIGISASLTPNRANGLYSIHLRMKQEALKKLMGA
jgi:cysteine desulfuration protein SufE